MISGIINFLMSAMGFIIIFAIIILIAGGAFYIVPQQRTYVIERLGKFNRLSPPGFHVKIPFIERVAGKLDLRTQQQTMDIDSKTKDNVTIGLQVAVQFRVDNMTPAGLYNAFYALADPLAQMESYIADSLRSSIPKYDLDEVFDKKDDIARDVQSDVTNIMNQYGYIIASTLIVSIELPRDVQGAMNEINTAQRQKVAAQSLADAERIKTVTEATAKAEAAEQAGIGVANQRKAIAEGINKSLAEIQQSGLTPDEANKLFMYTQWIDMMTEFGQSGKASTVVLPADFKETASMFESMVVADQTGPAPTVENVTVWEDVH